MSVSSNELPDHVRRTLHKERQATFFGCCRTYPKAVAWSLMLFCTIIMEAFDKSLIQGFIAFPPFLRRYGTPTANVADSADTQQYEISPTWQMGLQNAAIATEIIGLLAHGYITYVVGYRKMLVCCLIWLMIAIFASFFANSIEMLAVGQALCGFPWGVIQTLAATYAAEVVPSTLRAVMLSNVNMCWLIGQFAAMGVLRIFVKNDTQWSYRLPFAIQWAIAVPLIIGVCFCPDSPWWLVRHERRADARRALGRLTNGSHLDIDETIVVMEHTNETEKKYNYGGASYSDCFKGANRRRTEIACVVWACQALCGSTLTSYGAYFLTQAGFDATHSFTLSLGMYGMGILGGMISWVFLSYVGRRKLYLAGLSFALGFLTVGGISSVALTATGVTNWMLGGLIIAMTFTYNITIGPVCYVLVAEIPSTRLRVKTVALARVTYNIFMMLNNVVVPQMLNPTAWDMKGKVCFVYIGTTLMCLTWCYFRLPESKALSYLELDILFEKRAPTKKFKELQDRLQDSAYMSASRIERSKNAWHGWMAYS
ncbi:general substrate transporter [Dactylonectria macrodidyma]|uniref:General substrate transporter n=1 Tax=Dactylonectria macrodidyma TaxID=307937 RepID=A0A9P9EAP9_9HYPO|nr:general substrate transporter [Dactylonectria macrodidyma]